MRRVVAAALLLGAVNAIALPGTPPPPPTCTPPAILIADSTNCRPMTPCPIYKCVTPPQTSSGAVGATFQVTNVVYATPGRGGSVWYQSGQSFGSTTSLAHSWKNEVNVTFNAAAKVFFGSGDLTVSFGNIWSNERTDATDISLEVVNGWRKLGSGDYVDHNEDEVWFLASPHYRLTWTPAWEYGKETITWEPIPDAETQSYMLYVGELTGKWPIPPNVWDFLGRHGIKQADFPELLKATQYWGDPVPAGLPVDPARYQLVGVYAYLPAPYPGAPQDVRTLDVTRKVNNTSETKSVVTYKAAVKYGTNVSFIVSAKWNVENKFEFTTTSSQKLATGTSDKTTLSIPQPPYGYSGPTILRVYEDTVWKTLYSQLDWY